MLVLREGCAYRDAYRARYWFWPVAQPVMMSIATTTGDDGTTALMFGRRVSKTDPRIVANGACDELNAALGMVRAFCEERFITEPLFGIQKELVILMGELAVAAELD
jgi:cob(I)alamin adenosyltransferase